MQVSDAQKIEAIRKYYGLSVNALGKHLKLKSSQTLYDVIKGRNAISKGLAETILGKCIEINKTWLMTGEGEMIINEHIDSMNHEERQRMGILEESISILKQELADKQKMIEFLMKEVESYKERNHEAKAKAG